MTLVTAAVATGGFSWSMLINTTHGVACALWLGAVVWTAGFQGQWTV